MPEVDCVLEGPNDELNGKALQTLSLKKTPPEIPYILLGGKCPNCGHGMEQAEFLHEYRSVLPAERGSVAQVREPTAKPVVDDDIEMACSCAVVHPKAEGKEGCGRRWKLHLRWP